MKQKLNASEWCEIIGSRVDIFDGDGNLLRSADFDGLAEQSQVACDVFAREQQAEAERKTVLAQPVAPLPIDGATVEEVKASAETAIADLAEQMNARLALLTEGA